MRIVQVTESVVILEISRESAALLAVACQAARAGALGLEVKLPPLKSSETLDDVVRSLELHGAALEMAALASLLRGEVVGGREVAVERAGRALGLPLFQPAPREVDDALCALVLPLLPEVAARVAGEVGAAASDVESTAIRMLVEEAPKGLSAWEPDLIAEWAGRMARSWWRARLAEPKPDNADPAWRLARAQALVRDGHRCQRCDTSKELEVWHRYPVAPEEVAAEDLIVYCSFCGPLVRAQG